MNQTPSPLLSHFGGVELATLPVGREPFSPVEYRETYLNHLPIPVIMQWRNGLKVPLPPMPNLHSQAFIVRAEFTLRSVVKVDMIRLLSAVDEHAPAELKMIRDAFQIQVENNHHGGARIVLDYPLTLSQLQQYGGTVYYHEVDRLISVLPYEQVPPHPFSEGGERQRLISVSHAGQKVFGFGYSIDVIDNYGRYGDRYLNIGNEVYRIPAKKDPNRRCGIYVVSDVPTRGDLPGRGPEVRKFPFDGAEETIGLYRTEEDARTYGDMATSKRKELLDKETALNLAKTEAQLIRQNHEKELVEKDRALKEVQYKLEEQAREYERERLREEKERQRVKDFYEERKHVRNDQSETLKFLPAVVVGLGALFMAIKPFLGR